MAFSLPSVWRAHSRSRSLSGFLLGFVPWLVLGFALAVYALSARAAFRRYGLAGRGWVLAAMGVGQMLVSFSFAFPLGVLWVPIGLYWAGVLIVAVGFLKLWFWLRMESNRVLREIKRLELRIARNGGR